MDPISALDLPALDVSRDEQDPRVLLVRLDDPSRRNVMGEAMTASWVRLMEALRALGAQPGVAGEVRAVVLTGSGSAFSSGGDLSWLSDGTGAGATVAALRTRMARYYDDWLGVRSVALPVVAAVNGPAVGAGLGLALACDVRLVGASAWVSAPFTALGLHPGMATTLTLAQAVGPAVARELLLTGRAVGADEAVRLGLATSVHADDDLVEAALGVARTVATRSSVATRLLLQGLAGGGPRDLHDAVAQESLAQAVTLATDDLAEGLAAAREHRAPRFTGR